MPKPEGTKELNLRNLLSVSMDGPAVNWKFMDLLQLEHGEQFGGIQLQVVGSCGIHTLHNSFKGGFEVWHVEKVLRSLHCLFNNAPARREDFTSATLSSTFPLSFCGHRWLENVPAAERAIEIWPSIEKFVDQVSTKKVKNPGNASFDTLSEARKDPLICAKLHFFVFIARVFQPFLEKYQKDAPMMPFLWNDLEDLIRSLLKRFIKRDALPSSPYKLVRLDVTDQKLWLGTKDVDIGMGAAAVIKGLSGAKGRVSELGVLQFKKECQNALSKICKKALDKCPLKYATVHNMMCLDPRKMYSSPDECLQKLKRLIEKFVLDKQLTGGISSGDVISQQFEKALSNEAKSLEFANFQPSVSRVDTFLSQNLSSYTDLWNFCKKLLLLSHGQAEVERGFSINKEVETCNMSEETVVIQRLICDQVKVCGGVTKVPLTKELISYCASARSRYRAHLEEEKKKRETEENSKKRKYVEEDLKELKQKKKSIREICISLENDADRMAEQAESSGGSKMATLITESNSLRRRAKDKHKELIELDAEIENKIVELTKLS
ncbi:uncharacterized protein LOC113044351 isoform X2 [Carassius auratus]|uniref:Uncharacterized protein LOC113044351 isoform X2 n=1 Tax=Carassius auratus TaxID=7957 RepID=A0A6P6JK11_CARAU|nr:uncharacterized protein LOC113044351 isoform X2 [Carassius auratus]XP_026060064.1 uncharacterized protein LOC113044351 isoform X2 [Carassius auratus]